MNGARIVLITGTDSHVGKTFVTFGIARVLSKRGIRVRTVKPIETGCGPRLLESEDGVILARATGQRLPRGALDRLADPVAPTVAADRAGIRLDFAAWCDGVRALAIDLDVVLVEGAGGLLTPLTWQETSRDLAVDLGAEVLVVAPDRLGSLNHALLTLEVLRSASVSPVGVVFNAPPRTDQATGTNVAALRRITGLDRVASLPRLESIEESADHLGEVADWIRP